MTDKKNYIDGVDVTGCEWSGQFDLDINVICTSNSPKKCSAYCKDNPNCYYKQFKRKEQECEEYKQTLTEIKEIAKNMNKECFYDDFDCMHCNMQNGCTYLNKKQILQKISESEAENAR